jgi:hypothetical protein
VQATPAKALGRIGTEEDVGHLRRLLASSDARVRANAVEGLATLGTEEAFGLVEGRREDESPRVRANIAMALAKRDARRSIEDLKGMITSPERTIAESALREECERVRKALDPPGEARDDIWIIAQMAGRLGKDWGEVTAHSAWDELRSLVSPEVRETMRNPLIIDGRNLFDPAEVRAAGFVYEGFGRPASPLEALPETLEPERAPELEA